MKNESYFLAKKIRKKNRENEREKNESAKIRKIHEFLSLLSFVAVDSCSHPIRFHDFLRI